MAVNTLAMRNALVSAYAAQATHSALYSTAPTAGPSGAPGTELTGGSPAYARVPLSWAAVANSASSASATHNVASGSTVAGAGVHNGLTGTAAPDTTYRDGGTVPSQAFASQGTYQVTDTYTQS